ncbi:HU family DNA-binding protein [Iodobacter sp. BJB302]|uniref:HU family DNA-binding protein n=1 Tax=Iodobacter sp. BJB302 TaxID=1506510 RepID=UPI000C0CD318|nr:HU family DNA-binding protein [Iodobacter sp. BJB302]PHV02824.1 dipicolinate synthase [Iodobacter sp. BJB302]
MFKADLINQLTEKMKLQGREVSKTHAEAFLSALGEVTQEALAKGDDVTLPGLGKLSLAERAEREGRNPRTGETITIAASRSAKFSVSKDLKTAVNR